MSDHSTQTYILATIVGLFSIARTARLLNFDDFPPVKWLRDKAIAKLPVKWTDIAECSFCLAPYLTAGMIGWAYLSDLHWTWWVINGWWAAAYASAIIVAYDQPDEG